MMSLLPTASQSPPTEEEVALKEQVTQVLANRGILAKLKAELRAAVFQVMQEQEGAAGENYRAHDSTAPKLSDFPSETGATAVALIVECLRFFKWEHTLGVLLTETNTESADHESGLLAGQLGLDGSIPPSKPALFQLIESRNLGLHHSVASIRPVSKREHFDDDDSKDVDEVDSINNRQSSLTKKPWGQEDDFIDSRPAPSTRKQREQEDNPVEKRPAATATVAATIKKPWEKDEALVDIQPPPAKKSWEQEEITRQPMMQLDSIQKEFKTEDVESNADIEESMAEDVSSGSDLDESNFAGDDQEEGDDNAPYGSVSENKQTTIAYSAQAVSQFKRDDEEENNSSADDAESKDEDSMSLAAPPPAPAKLPSLPPLVGATPSSLPGDGDDDFDTELEAERLRKLDAALQEMEADDDTGTLQQLKASLQMELQEQDSIMSSGGGSKVDEGDSMEAPEPSKPDSDDDEDEDEDGYGDSDFEEEEEIASDISEEMESMPDLSDREDESEDGAATAHAEAELPRALQNDKRVESEDALNDYDYIEDVDKIGW